jgi:hypothetical protein
MLCLGCPQPSSTAPALGARPGTRTALLCLHNQLRHASLHIVLLLYAKSHDLSLVLRDAL